MIADFERQNGVRVEVVYKNDRAIMADLDGAKSGLDVLVMRHRWLGALVAKRQVRAIDSFLPDPASHEAAFHPQAELFPKWWRELSSYNTQTYGFPFTGLTAYLCYRKDLIEDAGNRQKFKARYHHELRPPATWRDYNELAEFFNRPNEKFYGTYIQGKQALALWYEWLNYIYSFNGDILDTQHGWDYGDIVVNSPQNVAATEEYVSAIKFSPPDTLKFGWNEAQSSLQQGRVFMGVLWSDQAPFLENPAVSKVAGKIGYTLIPSNSGAPSGQLEGLTYLIPTASQHPREAYKFLEWAMSAPVQTRQTLNGGGSLRESTYTDPDVKRLAYTPAFLESLPLAKSKPTVPESDQMTEAMERRLFEIVSGRATPRNGLDALAVDLQNILGAKARLRFPVTPKS